MTPFLHKAIKIAAGLLLAKLAISIAIQLRPTPTPPVFRFLLNNPIRRRYRDPMTTLENIGVRAGMQVLELGPGVGMFTVAAARLVGDRGRLLCLDLQMSMLRPLQRLARRSRLTNVSVQAADAAALPLADSSVDLAYLIAVLPMIPDRRRALAELRRVLKPSGVLAISEELLEPEYVPAIVTAWWCRKAGFELRKRYGNLWCYTLVFHQDLRDGGGLGSCGGPGYPSAVRSTAPQL
jgi:SAM-dependent methyltransferase